MDRHSENTRRIARNTLMLYVRMLFSMLVSLYTSRVVLNTLGVEDYGIFNVVGGLVAMFAMVSNSLSAAVSRFLTFELGRGDMEKLKQVFSTSLLIHLLLAVIIVILAETAGMWFLNTHMTIPDGRLPAARLVLHTSVAGFAMSLLSVPYNASIVSHERMDAYAYIGILDVLLKLAAVLLLAYAQFSCDKLIMYAVMLLVISFMMQCIYITYCRSRFEECRLRLGFDRGCWKEISSFAGWNFIGASSALLKDQGVNILLNVFIGPVANAARGIATSVNSAVCSFSRNFMTAINPQITKSYAAGEREYMMSLVERGSRFSFYMMLVFSLPILLETDFILTVWLKQYPEHTANFVRLVLLLSMCDALSNTLITLQLATGKIRNYQIVVGGMQLMNFPLSWICLKAGMPPESVYVVAILVSLASLALRLLFLRSMAGLSIRRYLMKVCVNVLAVAAVALLVPLVTYACLQDFGWIRFVVVCIVSVLSVLASAFVIGCTKSEKGFFMDRFKMIKAKVLG